MKPGNAGGAKGSRKRDCMECRTMQKEIRKSDSDICTGGRAAQRIAQKSKASIWTPAMLEALDRGVKGGKWFSLMDKVYRMSNLKESYERVRKNNGAPGVDRVTVGQFGGNLNHELERLEEQLKGGTYKPSSIKRCYIPKPGSRERRPIGIPTVRDRVVQAALAEVISPIFEYEFRECSYGFRPKRGCKDALRNVVQALNEGYRYVVDADIKDFFGTLDHDLLMELIKRQIADGKVLELIKLFLTQGVMEEDRTLSSPELGTPQGGVVSPLLANIYLHELDVKLEDQYRLVRYADDLVLMCKSAEEAQGALSALEAVVSELKLTLHPTKTKIVAMTQRRATFVFLGYKFVVVTGNKIARYPSKKSRTKLRGKLRPMTRRNSGESMSEIVDKINHTLHGWFEDFKHSSITGLESMDGWVRRRLRAILDQRCNRRRTMGTALLTNAGQTNTSKR